MQQFAFQVHIDTLIALGQKSAIAASAPRCLPDCRTPQSRPRMLNPIPLDLSGGGSHTDI